MAKIKLFEDFFNEGTSINNELIDKMYSYFNDMLEDGNSDAIALEMTAKKFNMSVEDVKADIEDAYPGSVQLEEGLISEGISKSLSKYKKFSVKELNDAIAKLEKRQKSLSKLDKEYAVAVMDIQVLKTELKDRKKLKESQESIVEGHIQKFTEFGPKKEDKEECDDEVKQISGDECCRVIQRKETTQNTIGR